MNFRELLERKKRGGSLSTAEMRFLVEGSVNGRIPDYQMAAFLMAVWFRGLDDAETLALTEAMLQSGRVLDLSSIDGPKIDKHSTGGVGDKVSLPLIGVAMAAGLRVPMLSGRALGHTGGTLDKLESIPGYSTRFEEARFLRALRHPGGTIVGQSDELVPADRELYALRDVTATIDCVPLIVASILSKKFAAGVDGVVLDVKVGSGAFMHDLERARELAGRLVAVGDAFGRSVVVRFSRMDEPLGEAVGNANEVIEAVELLRGRGPQDVRALTLELVADMLSLARVEDDLARARQRAEAVLQDGTALERFRALVEAQGGRLDWDRPDCGLELAPVVAVVQAPRRASLVAVEGAQVGWAVVELGGGRQRKDEPIDPAVGLHWKARIGDLLQAGQVVAEVRARPGRDVSAVVARLEGSLTWGEAPAAKPPLLLGRFPEAR